jgi:DNA polymerase-3 subunit gamma/tau
MPAQALYLKYRPHTFGQVEGQEHVTRTLRNALALGRTTHAYLFTGPRGTGKTTIARLLAKAVNCLAESGDRPCNTCAVCIAINEGRMLDLIEIDAASNTSVDDIRDLRDKVDYRPGEARFKVYIVDEVHMLSTAAFNALLKTLEEPPPHVIFILATTDPQKIPATVLSRVQRFDFRRLTIAEITERLAEIAAGENLKIEPAALELVARQATGALRDAISLLDQLISYGGDEITLAQVQGLLGAGSHQAIGDLIGRLAAQDVAGSLSIVTHAVDGGADPRQLAREIVEYLRGLLLIQTGNGDALTMTADAQAEMKERAGQFKTEELLRAIRLFNQAAYELRVSANPTLPLELAIVESLSDQVRAAGSGETVIRSTPVRQNAETAKAPPPAASASPNNAPNRPAPPRRGPAKPNPPAPSATTEEPAEPAGPLSLQALNENWDRVLARVRVYNKVVEALLRGAEPIQVSEDVVTLGFYYQQHADRFEKVPDGKALIEKALLEVLHQKCRVKCVLSPRRAKLKAVEEDPLIRAAVNQMGAEITEIHEEE